MSLRFLIQNTPSSNIRVKKYSITVYNGSSILSIYQYSRSSTIYNGVFLPSYFEIYAEANKLVSSSDFSCGYRNDYNSILTLKISDNRIVNHSSVSTKNSDVLGKYLYSSSVSLDFLIRSQTHFYEYGYIVEKYASLNLGLFNIEGELKTSFIFNNSTPAGEPLPSPFNDAHLVGRVNCKTLIIKYYITSLPPPPDTKAEEILEVPKCSFSYRFYSTVFAVVNGMRILDEWLEVKDENGSVVYKEFASRRNGLYFNNSHAMSIVQPFIDSCKENSKIETTCCLLVCCEPNKYKLI